MTSVRVTWAAPASSLPVRHYVLRYWRVVDGTRDAAQRLVFGASTRDATLGGLSRDTAYSVELQAWTAAVDAGACSAGENALCSQWSENVTAATRASGNTWYVSPQGSYFYGNGSLAAPFAPDIQGLIDHEMVVTGHEIVMMEGLYGDVHKRGPGRAQDLNFHGKLISIRSLSGAASTVVDCGGKSRFFTFSNLEPASVKLVGLTIRNCGGHADGRGAVYVTNQSTPTIERCVFDSNVAERGAALPSCDDVHLARPRSASLRWPAASIRKLSGLMSRWA